jgi:hypothetical protein
MTHERTDEHDPEAEVRLGLQDALDPAHYERALDEIMARLAHAEHDLQGHDECDVSDEWPEVKAGLAELARLRAALGEAIEDIESWASYASPYFQEKWDLAGDLAKHRAALTTPEEPSCPYDPQWAVQPKDDH